MVPSLERSPISPQHNRPLIPKFILDRLARGELTGHLEAGGVFIDLSGFTFLTESLMAHGHYGAEVLAIVVESIFEPLIDTIFTHHGFVAGFHGDAFTALFPVTNGERVETAWLALAAAWRMQEQMASLATQNTPFGEFLLTAKMGIDLGMAEWAILTSQDGGRAAYSFMGDVVARCAQAENLAAQNEIILTPALREILGERVGVAPLGDHARLAALHAPLPAPAPALVTPPSRSDLARFLPAAILDLEQRGEFRQVVALFLNLKGTPRLEELQRFSEQCFALQHQFGGIFHRITFDDKGCNLQLYWGAPTRQERDVNRALNFILDLRRESGLVMRAGITHRMAFAGFVGSSLYQEYTCYSRGINLAARLMSAADWGQIWLSDEVARLVDQQYQIEFLGERSFKGFGVSQAVYQLHAPETEARPAFYRGRLVGREEELLKLQQAVSPLLDGRFAGITTIVGEAGSGKSRLAHEYLAGLVAAGQARVLRGQTDDILRQPLNPFRYILRYYFDQSPHGDPVVNREQFERIMLYLITATVDPILRAELERTRSFLGSLVDLHWPDSLYEQVEPQLRVENTFEGLIALLKAESLRQPLIILLEDVHFLDSSSRAFLAHLTRNLDNYPVALLATSRQDPAPDWFEPESPQETIRLSALPESAVDDMIATLLGNQPPPMLARRLAAETAGNPLFIEQLLLYLRNNQLLETYAEPRTDSGKTTGYLPADIRSLLVAQIDQLPSALKQTAQVASVLGREFDAAILAGMLHAPGNLEHTLALGSERDVWYPLEDRRYLFHHALLREVAYDMQLRSRRRELHHLAAGALIANAGGDSPVITQLAEIAFHFDQAELAESAGNYYGRAGRLAAGDYFNEQAIAYLDRALELIPMTDPESRFNIILEREAVFGLLGRRDEQSADLKALEELAEWKQDAGRWAELYLRQAAYSLAVGDYNAAIALAERSAARAAEAGDSLAELKANHRLGRAYWHQGRSLEAEPYLRHALALARAGSHTLQTAECLYDLGAIFQYRENYRETFNYSLEAQEIFRGLNNRRGEILCLNLIGNAYYVAGDFVESRAAYETALALAGEIGWRFAETTVLNNIGNSLFELGDFSDAQRYFMESVDLARRTGDRAAESVALDTLGLIVHYQGNLDQARQHLEDACEIALNIHNARYCGYSLTHLGFTLLELGQLDSAISRFEHALTLRQELGHETGVTDTLAGLAAAEAARGDLSHASQYAKQIVAWIDQNGADGLELPVQTYWICYDILHQAAGGDPAAEAAATAILKDGYALLQRRANRITDDGLRRRFLQEVPFNRKLLEVWAAANPSSGE